MFCKIKIWTHLIQANLSDKDKTNIFESQNYIWWIIIVYI